MENYSKRDEALMLVDDKQSTVFQYAACFMDNESLSLLVDSVTNNELKQLLTSHSKRTRQTTALHCLIETFKFEAIHYVLDHFSMDVQFELLNAYNTEGQSCVDIVRLQATASIGQR